MLELSREQLWVVSCVIALGALGIGIYRASLLAQFSLLSGGISLGFLTGWQEIVPVAGYAIESGSDRLHLDSVRLLCSVAVLGGMAFASRCIRWRRILLSYEIFLLICLVSMIFSFAVRGVEIYPVLLFCKLLLPYLILLPFYQPNQAESFRSTESFMWGGASVAMVIAAGMYLADMGFKRVTTQDGPVGVMTSFSGPTGSHAAFGLLMGVMATYWLSRALFRDEKLAYLPCLLSAAAVLPTTSRTAILATTTALCTVSLMARKRGATLLFVLMPVLFLIMSPNLRLRMFNDASGDLARILSLEAVYSINTQGRLDVWEQIADMVFQDPAKSLMGWGFGHSMRMLSHLEFPHNEYLRVFSELGVIGLCAFLYCCGDMLWRCLKAFRASEGRGRTLPATGVAAMVMFLVNSFGDNTFDLYLSFGQFVFAFVGLAMASSNPNEVEAHSRHRADPYLLPHPA